MTITALSQPDYETDILTNGTLEDTFAQDSDANYDLDIQTSASTTDSQSYQSYQPENTLGTTDSMSSGVTHIQSVDVPNNTEVTVSINADWTIGTYSGELDITIEVTNDAGTVLTTKSWENIDGDNSSTLNFRANDTLSASETSENFYVSATDPFTNSGTSGDIVLSTTFDATPTLSSSYTVNSVTQS